jgi:uroporphyrinogen-III synthase
MRLLVTRPEQDAQLLKARLEQLDHEVLSAPLLSLSFSNADPIDLTDVQVLIATSRNGIKGLAAQPRALELARPLALFAVGPGTAKQARLQGLGVIITGAGTARDLVPQLVTNFEPSDGLLLQLAGDVLAYDLEGDLAAHGFRMLKPVVYHMQAATTLPYETIEMLGLGEVDGVLLLSPRTADIYVQLVTRYKLLGEGMARPTYYCLSSAIAARLKPLGPVRIEIAPEPTLEGLLALVT